VPASLGGGSIYTQLVDPANTSFTFLISGHSNLPDGQVTASVNLTRIDQADGSGGGSVYSGNVTGNAAGDWTMALALPVGLDLMNNNVSVKIGAATGLHTLQSVSVIASSVPEIGRSWMMGMGLVGLATLATMRSRTNRH
jgi:hypothetical protein